MKVHIIRGTVMDFATGNSFPVYAVAPGKTYFVPESDAVGFGNAIKIVHITRYFGYHSRRSVQ